MEGRINRIEEEIKNINMEHELPEYLTKQLIPTPSISTPPTKARPEVIQYLRKTPIYKEIVEEIKKYGGNTIKVKHLIKKIQLSPELAELKKSTKAHYISRALAYMEKQGYAEKTLRYGYWNILTPATTKLKKMAIKDKGRKLAKYSEHIVWENLTRKALDKIKNTTTFTIKDITNAIAESYQTSAGQYKRARDIINYLRDINFIRKIQGTNKYENIGGWREHYPTIILPLLLEK